MEKKRRPISITELDVEPISSEEFAAILGNIAEEPGGSLCGCVLSRSDVDWCQAT